MAPALFFEMAYTLQFPIEVGSPEPLKTIGEAVRQVAENTKLGQGNLSAFSQILQQTAQQTGSLRSALQDLAGKTSIFQQFAKDVQSFLVEQERATAAVKKFDEASQGSARGFTSASQARVRQLQQEVDQQERSANRLEQVFGKIGGRLGGMATGIPGGGFIGSQLIGGLGLPGAAAAGLGAGAIGLFGALEIGKHVEELAKWAQAQQNAARELGITNQQMEILSRISDETGFKLEGLAKAASDMGTEILKGGERAREIQTGLKDLGLGAGVAFKPAYGAMEDIIHALERIPDPAERSRRAIELLGETAGRQAAAIADNWDKLTASTSKRLLSDTQIHQLDEARQRMKELGEAWDLVIARAVKPVTFVLNVVRNIIPGGGSGSDHPNRPIFTAGPNAPDWLKDFLPPDQPVTRLPLPRTPPALAMPDPRQGRSEEIQKLIEGTQSPRERMEAQLRSLETERQNAEQSFIDKGGDEAYQKVEKLNAAIVQLKANLEGLKRGFAEAFAEFNAKGQPTEYQRQTNELGVHYSELIKLPGANISDATASLNRQLTQLRQANQDKLDEKNRKTDLQEFLEQNQIGEDIQSQLRKQFSEKGSPLNEIFNATPQAGGPPGPSAREAGDILKDLLRQRSKYATSRDPAEDAKDLLDFKKQELFIDQQIAENEAKAITDKGDQEKKLYDVRLQYAREVYDAEADYTLKLAQLREQKEEEFKSLAVGFVNAAESNKLPEFFKQQGRKVQDTIVGNAAGMLFNGPVTSMFGNFGISSGSFLGDLLKGTPFAKGGITGPNDPVAISNDANTAATSLNTLAVAALYEAITGQDPGSLVPGLVGVTTGTLNSGGLLGPTGVLGSLFTGTGSLSADSPMATIAGIAKAFGFSLPGVPTAVSSGFGAGGSSNSPLALIGNVIRAFTGGSGGTYGSGSSAGMFSLTGEGSSGVLGPFQEGGFVGPIDNNNPANATPLASSGFAIPGGNYDAGGFENYPDLANSGFAIPGSDGTAQNTFSFPKIPNLNNNPLSTLANPNSTTGQDVTAGLAVAGAAYGAYTGIKEIFKGGAQNVIGGLGTTAMSIAPLTGPAAPFVAAGGAVLDLVSALMGDPRVNRQNTINKRLFTDQFYNPVPINVSAADNGELVSQDRYGNIRTSNVSPFPTVQEPYLDIRNQVSVPGRVLTPYGGAASFSPQGYASAANSPSAPVTINHNYTVTAMDSSDFGRLLEKHMDTLSDKISQALVSGRAENVVNALQQRN